MHRLDNLKYHEIASRLGISQSAVEKHIAKAVLFLTEWTRVGEDASFLARFEHLKEAADWLARLRADDRSWEDERAFRAWMAADPKNAVAFEAANATWESVGALPRDMRDGRVDLEPSMDRRVLLGRRRGRGRGIGRQLRLPAIAEAEVYQTDIGEQKHVSLHDGTTVFSRHRTPSWW